MAEKVEDEDDDLVRRLSKCLGITTVLVSLSGSSSRGLWVEEVEDEDGGERLKWEIVTIRRPYLRLEPRILGGGSGI